MRALLLMGLLAWTAAAQASPTWDSLWRTPDQRAQQLLHQGKPAEASRLFQDPRRKAYAELQAGNFAQAAQDFAAFSDSDGQYNRGNALARAGRLQEAIQAYDAALARDPNNRDARHNRELVAKALQKQRPKPASASGQGQQGNTSQKNQKQGDQGRQKQNSGSQNGEASKPSSNNTAQANQPGQNPAGGSQTQPAGQGQLQPRQQQAGQARPAPDRRNADANGSQQEQAANEAALARSDAEAGLARPQAGQSSPAANPPSERQLAEEQWLRRIPDDPGGLLRRKFMIEHIIRQQGTQP